VQADAIDAQAQVLEAGAAPDPGPAGPAPLLTKQELASALRVSTATVDRLCRDGKIPIVRVGESRRFDLASVRCALEALSVQQPPTPPSQPASEAATGVRLLTRRRSG
jgi:excisionase family DNA binding protein